MAEESKYLAELSAIQRWVKATVNLDSFRNKEAPPKLARPVILWEAPQRGRDRNLSRWAYVNKVTQYGKLYVVSVEQLAAVQENLLSDLEERTGVLPVYDTAGVVVTKLKNCEINFNTTENLNIPFNLVYEVAYARVKPPAAPNAIYVGNRIKSDTKGYDVKNY